MGPNERRGSGPTAQILDTVEEHTRACGMGLCSEHTFYFIRVLKGQQEGEVEVLAPEFVISLDRSCGTRLGLKLDLQGTSASLFIKEVVGGLAYNWNAACSKDRKIRPGDRIVRVNKVEGDAMRLMEECKRNEKLDLTVLRGQASPVVPGLTVKVKRAVGQLKVGIEGIVVKLDEDGDALIRFTDHGQQWVAKQDYDKFSFEDSERFYMKRYCDFKELYQRLKAKQDSGVGAALRALPEMPGEERFGFRRQLSSLGMSSFMTSRKDGLQKYLDAALSQVTSLEQEPTLAQFFGATPIPEAGADIAEALKKRMDVLIPKHRAAQFREAVDRETSLGEPVARRMGSG